jgi:hypothetical protein
LLPHLRSLRIKHLQAEGRPVRLEDEFSAGEGRCPDCGSGSSRVHSRYQRTLADPAIGGRQTVLTMRVRRFFCDEIACAHRTFAEQVPGLTTPYARRTPLLRGILEKVALALGGRPGSRMSRLLAVGSSLTLSGPGFSPRRRPRNDGIHGSPPRHLGGHPARRYNYWLGGKDNFAADRESGDEIAEFFPTIRVMAVENRRLLRRAVGYLAEEAGIRQFLDIGTGLPTADNTHEVAQRIAPRAASSTSTTTRWCWCTPGPC